MINISTRHLTLLTKSAIILLVKIIRHNNYDRRGELASPQKEDKYEIKTII